MPFRTLVLVAVAAAALILAAPAVAKEIEAVSVCGADGCRSVEVDSDDHALIGGGPPGEPPAKDAPFFRIRLAIGDGSGQIVERLTTLYVPSVAKLRGFDGTWMDTAPATTRALDRVIRGREPLAAAQLPAAVERTSGGSLPPRTVRFFDDEPSDGGAPVALIALAAAGGLALAGGALWALRRRTGRTVRPAPAQ